MKSIHSPKVLKTNKDWNKYSKFTKWILLDLWNVEDSNAFSENSDLKPRPHLNKSFRKSKTKALQEFDNEDENI
jgi:hypothetical protein